MSRWSHKPTLSEVIRFLKISSSTLGWAKFAKSQKFKKLSPWDFRFGHKVSKKSILLYIVNFHTHKVISKLFLLKNYSKKITLSCLIERFFHSKCNQNIGQMPYGEAVFRHVFEKNSYTCNILRQCGWNLIFQKGLFQCFLSWGKLPFWGNLWIRKG